MTSRSGNCSSLFRYMTSPLWTVPLATFVENNCIVFEGAEENMIGHTIIHEKYVEVREFSGRRKNT